VPQNLVHSLRYHLERLIGRFTDLELWRLERRLLGPALYERYRFYERQGYWLRLDAPRTFNEKIAHRKLRRPLPQSAVLADKFSARGLVAERGHAAILNKVFCCGPSLDVADLARLPSRYVVKATHASGWIILVPDAAHADRSAIVREANGWLGARFGEATNETYYAEIQPRVMVEEYLDDGTGEVPRDFKFFVFHGRCELLHVDHDRFGSHRQRFYDRNWVPQPFNWGFELGPVIERPAALDRMIAIAESLAAGTDFLRIDLYLLGEEDIRFGEITLAPNAGWLPLAPWRQVDMAIGALW
jgi:hypothetical protein